MEGDQSIRGKELINKIAETKLTLCYQSIIVDS